MNAKAIVIGMAGLLAVAAFAGVFTPAMADEPVASPEANGPRGAFWIIQESAPAGVSICSGPGHDSATAMPYGTVVMWEAAEAPLDDGRTPEDYLGYIADPANGYASDTGLGYPDDYYVYQDFGSRMIDWDPALVYYLAAEVIPDEYGGHSPQATVNYTAYTKLVWANDGDQFPSMPLTVYPTLAGADNAGNMVLTWTDMADPNVVNPSYVVYKKIGAGAWTLLSTVAEGTQTYTDIGGYVLGNFYTIGLMFPDGEYTTGRSNIVPGGGGDIIPTANAGVDQSVPVTTTVTFDGSASTDDNGITGYSWTFTDVTPKTLVGVGPTYQFNNVGVFTVTLTVTDTIGQTDTDTMTVTVSSDAIPPVANAGPDQTVNEDTLVTFDGSLSTDNIGVTSYSWAITGGTPAVGVGVAPTSTFANPGVYTVTLTVSDAAGNTDTDDVVITVNDNSPIAVTDTTPGTVEPGMAFDISCVGTDYQALVAGSIVLYYEDVAGAQLGPVAASTFTSVGDQLTKADEGDEPMDTHTYTWAIPAQALPGEVHYWFATDDGAGHTATDPVGATFLANYATILVQVAGNQNQPHPLIGFVLDPLGTGLNGATVQAQWYDSTEGLWFTMTTLTVTDGLGNDGWFQIDIYQNNWTIGDLLYVNATFNIAGVDYYGYNTTLFASGDNILPDDDKEYVNVTIVIQEYFELKWTLGWNIWSHPMVRSENVSLGLTDLQFSWFGAQHWMDTAQLGIGDDCTLVAWNGATYTTFVYPLDNGTGNDVTVVLDYAYWAFVGESWFTDEAALAIPEQGIFVPGQYVWRSFATRSVAVNAGWNLLGWTSFNATYVATDVIWTLTTGAVSPDGVPQPELIANWTADAWELGAVADMVHYEGVKGYTTFVNLGVYGQSLPAHDFPVGAGYGFWVYSEVGGQTLTYNTQ